MFSPAAGDWAHTNPETTAMRFLLLAAAGAAMIAGATDARATHPRTELLIEQRLLSDHRDSGHDRYQGRGHRHHPGCRHDRHPGHHRHHRDRDHGHGYRSHAVDRARWYARRSVEQARKARRLGFRFDHPRWSLSYNRHFEWALRADAGKLERELRKRARKLRELRRYGYAPHHGPAYAPYPYRR